MYNELCKKHDCVFVSLLIHYVLIHCIAFSSNSPSAKMCQRVCGSYTRLMLKLRTCQSLARSQDLQTGPRAHRFHHFSSHFWKMIPLSWLICSTVYGFIWFLYCAFFTPWDDPICDFLRLKPPEIHGSSLLPVALSHGHNKISALMLKDPM